MAVAYNDRREKRRQSHFHAWNSYLAKIETAGAALVARRRTGEVAIVQQLTIGLLEAYEGINEAYYRRKREEVVGKGGVQGTGESTLETTALEVPGHGKALGMKGDGKELEGRKVSIYCDENFNYIVRKGELFNMRYMLEKVVGKGSFGQVVRAYDTRTKDHVAIKIIKNSKPYFEQALSEVRMTAYLNRIDPDDTHSIMRLRDKFIFRGHQCLVLELLSFSLYDLLRSTEFYGVSLNLVRKFCKQILSCLYFLAKPEVNIIHCDLKPENVLLRHPQRSAIKVVDFGSSCRASETMYTYVQSRFYRAPEVLLGLPYSTQIDVWSLGCMLVELYTGYPIFAGIDEVDQMHAIVERLDLPPKWMLEAGTKTHIFFDVDPNTGKYLLKPSNNPKRSPLTVPGSKPISMFLEEYAGAGSGRRKRDTAHVKEADYDVFTALANRMLDYDPNTRITPQEALRHPYITGKTSPEQLGRAFGRESPPPIPTSAKIEDLVHEIEPGRTAPVQNGSISLRNARTEVGGQLRISRSETSIKDTLSLMPQALLTHWAEEVGIEPPPWRQKTECNPFAGPSQGQRSLFPAGSGRQLASKLKRDSWISPRHVRRASAIGIGRIGRLAERLKGLTTETESRDQGRGLGKDPRKDPGKGVRRDRRRACGRGHGVIVT